ncbi:MAG TPA: hypothetical protein VIY56_17365 [Vicinamibacterales bacterium]
MTLDEIKGHMQRVEGDRRTKLACPCGDACWWASADEGGDVFEAWLRQHEHCPKAMLAERERCIGIVQAMLNENHMMPDADVRNPLWMTADRILREAGQRIREDADPAPAEAKMAEPGPGNTPGDPSAVDTFIPNIGTVRSCLDCSALVAGGPTRCGRCAREACGLCGQGPGRHALDCVNRPLTVEGDGIVRGWGQTWGPLASVDCGGELAGELREVLGEHHAAQVNRERAGRERANPPAVFYGTCPTCHRSGGVHLTGCSAAAYPASACFLCLQPDGEHAPSCPRPCRHCWAPEEKGHASGCPADEQATTTPEAKGDDDADL